MKDNHMKIFYKLFFIFLLLPFISLNAGNSDNKDSTEFNFKAHSIQFKVNSFFNLSDFQGSFISYKYHFNNSYAIRIGLGFEFDLSSGDYENTYRSNDSLYMGLTRDYKRYEIGFASQILKYFRIQNSIKIYFGSGPFFSTRIYQRTYKDYKSDTQNIPSNYLNTFEETKRLFYGLSTVFGVEWFFMKDVSLIAEYNFILTYQIIKSEEQTFTDNTFSEIRKIVDERSGFYSESQRAKLGLSIYF